MAKTIFVRAATQDHKVVLSEYDEQHPGPNHEAWVTGDERIWEVGKTAQVQAKLTSGDLIEVDAAEARQLGVSPPPGSEAPPTTAPPAATVSKTK